MPGLQQEVFWRGASRPRQVLPHAVLQVQVVQQVACAGRLLPEGRGLLLHSRLPAQLRHAVRHLQGLR